MTRFFSLLFVLALAAVVASAMPITYVVQVNTPAFGIPGWIDFSFQQQNALTSLQATASISDFQQTDFVMDTTVLASDPAITGSLTSPPLVIPNDVGGTDDFLQHVTSWGSSFQFLVTISGPAVGTPALDGSGFLLTLYDDNFNYLEAPLGNNEVANITINPDGTLTGNGSFFEGGSATVSLAPDASVPEPGTALLGAAALAALIYRRHAQA